jgi:two-component system nitrate/nitrite response regulator NarL
MADKLKLVLVDDQSLCRRGLSELLANCYDFSVLGATDNLDELRSLLKGEPDLLIIDLRMKPLDGISLLQLLRSEGYTTPAIMLTMSDSGTDLTNAIRAGVRGYLLKDMAPDDVVDAIRRVAAGELVVAPTMTMTMIEMLRGDQPGQDPKSSLKLLTEREREILQLLARGESNKAIAKTLKISYDTVKQHVRHILNKLNLSSRVKAAVLFAKEQDAPNSDSESPRC